MAPRPASLAKITRPIPAGIYPRKRLFRLLDGARKRPVVWLSAPAGSGKTTLVGSYLSARGVPCLWYQVDPGDQDIASFFYYMGLAAQRAAPRRRKRLPLLAPEYLPGLSAFTQRYFEDLFGRLAPGSVVVFDDYQKVPAESRFHDVIRDGLSRLPDGMNAVVISRADPPPPFARKRVYRRMELLGWNELRLTPEETRGIARLRGRVLRGSEGFRTLQSRSGGWVAGLVLLLEKSLREAPKPRKFSDRAPEEVFEFFAGEVFEALEEEAKSFLLKSAFLPKMTVRMAEKITGHRRAGTILSYLNRHNYFTELHRNPEPVYTYHPLFRDFLLTRAEDVFSAKYLHRLRTAAGAALEESGYDEDAAGLYRGLGDRDGVTRIVLRQAHGLVRQGRSGTLMEWIASLPGEARAENPWLLYWTGVCRLHSRPGESLRDFEEAFRRFRLGKDPEGALLSWSGAVDAIVYGPGSLKSLDPWFSTLAELLAARKSFPSPEVENQVTCTVIKALALRRPSFVDMEKWAERATELARSTGDASLGFSFLLNVAYYRFHTGDFQPVGPLLDSLRGMTRKPEVSSLPRLSLCWLEAAYANSNGLHDRCMNVVEEGLELADATGVHLMDFLLMGQGALGALNAGDAAAAKQYLRKMASSLSLARPWEAAFYHHIAAWEALSRGNAVAAAPHSERSVRLSEEVGNPWTLLAARLQSAFVFHALGERAAVEEHLCRARDIATASGNEYGRFACLLSEAFYSLDPGGEESAAAALREGMRLGRERGFLNLYMWRPGVLSRVAARALDEKIEVPYVQELIRRNSLVPEGDLGELENWPWPVRVRTLGRFELVREGTPVRRARKVQQKPLRMLQALIAFGGTDIAEEQLTDVLWPEADGDLAHQSFATNLHRLRQLLGNDKAVLLREGRTTLNPRYCWVDVVAFDGLLRQADAEHKEGVAGRVRRLSRAIDLYRGPFLDGEGSQAWIVPVRERLRIRVLRAVGELGRHWERAQEWEKAVDCYRRFLETDELAEEICRRLMACQKRLGRSADAAAAYHRFRKSLAHALGRPPSPETENLFRSLEGL